MELIIFSVVGAIVGMIVFRLFGSNSSKYRCSHCQSPNNDIKDAKSKKLSHTKFAHTRKDGERDRRYNQSGTQVYDLVFDCVDCGKEFEIRSDGYVGSQADSVVQGLISSNPKFAKALKKHADGLDDLEDEIQTNIKNQKKRNEALK